MNKDRFIRSLHVFWRAETIIADIQWRRAVLGIAAISAALLLATLAITTLGIAIYFALEPSWGRVWAMAAIGGLYVWLAAIALLIAIKPLKSRELSLATEVRDEALQVLSDQVQDVRDDLGSFVRALRRPFDGAMLSFLVPAAGLVLKSFVKSDKAAKTD
jgi:hypothetical protein